ncbi:protein LIM3-like [Zingiber officinale]|uniref:protein LIM3-like n=1 Tax=Zingiber officinale TaxID=94328 RepID=UPI001C4B5EFA|nr:protein LIM3-like [Zingiber officinale]
MAHHRAPFFVCAIAIVAALLLSAASPASAQFCGADLGDLLADCMKYVRIPGPKVNPSAACCAEIKKVDLPCLCDNLPPGIEKRISLEKAVFVARKCGKTVRKGTKCGDFTVPSLM